MWGGVTRNYVNWQRLFIKLKKKNKDNETLQIPPEKLKLLNQMVYSDSQKVIGRSLRVCECDLAKTVKRIQKKYQVEVESYTLQKTKLWL